MKFGDREDRVGIFSEVAERKQWLGDEAMKNPHGREDYMALSIAQRMQVAKNVVARYTPRREGGPYGQYETPATHRQKATAEFEPDDHPGMLLRGTVVSEAMPSTDRGLLHGLFIWAHAVDPTSGIESHSTPFGAVLTGQAVLDPDFNWDGQAVALEDPAAAHIIEFIDEATIGLLESVVRDHRRFVGQQAVSG